ncbi:hypothetical protein GCM10023170_069320 [Phytohabitans houttuyneae]
MRAPKRPAGRAGAALLTVATLAGILTAAAGIGYTASRPLLGDGSAFLGKGHTVAHVNGETGKSDAEVAMQLATGKETLQPVRMPDGRLAIVNKDTGTVSYLDAATLAPDAPAEQRPTSKGRIEPVPTESDGYLVDQERDTVEKITKPGQSPPPPVSVPDGIKAVVPCADSVWLTTEKDEVVEVVSGREVRRFRLGAPLLGLTVSDSHPIAVTADGTAYMIDGETPRAVGKLGIAGTAVVLGAWRGAGRHVLAVDRASGTVAALDPRTGRGFTVQLKLKSRGDLAAPVTLGSFAYVPDYAGPSLWKIDLGRATAASRPLDVPGQPGPFELSVSGGRVWANNQYDRSVLVVDANGHERYADKGTGAELTDTEGQTGPPGGGSPTDPKDPPTQRPPSPQGPPKGPDGRLVTVPSFARGTPHEQACATITELGLRCRAVSAGDDEPGVDPGDVLGTSPAAGRRVPVGSRVVVRYAGPLRTPEVTGLPYREACRQVTAARLRCEQVVSAEVAIAPEQLGVVSAQAPQAQTEISRNSLVTVTYPDSIALPNVADQAFGAACTRLEELYKMRCQAVLGGPVTAGKQAGQVQSQEPAAGTVAKMGTTVTLRYYKGESTPGTVVGANISAACGAIQAEGLECVPVEGTCAQTVGRPVGEVYGQDPPAGQTVAVGSRVTLTYYGDKCTVPGYGGQGWEAACNDINARGFSCNAVPVLNPTPGVVLAQDPPAGTYQLGTPVTIHYSPWTPVPTVLGAAYPPGTQIPGARVIYHYTCDAGGDLCRGLPRNEFYSGLAPGSPTIGAHFRGAAYAVLMTCGTAAGQARVWRTWNGGSPRYYQHVRSESPPPADDREELGCVW